MEPTEKVFDLVLYGDGLYLDDAPVPAGAKLCVAQDGHPRFEKGRYIYVDEHGAEHPATFRTAPHEIILFGKALAF